MPVPTSIDDLDPVAANNSPPGTEPVLPLLDNYMRFFSSCIAQLRDELEGKADTDEGIPTGCIVMWSGAVANIPSGWNLCDGTNGTPNLRDKFVIGAGNSYAVGAAGGSKDAIVVAHTHTVSGDVTTSSSGGHQHLAFNSGTVGSGTAVDDSTYAYRDRTGGGEGNYNIKGTASAADVGLTSSAGAHTHTASLSGTTGSAGASGTNANLPPYFALCFIMKG